MEEIPTLLDPNKLVVPEALAGRKSGIAVLTEWVKKRMPEFGGRGGALADRIIVVKAMTASGKSTIMPVHLFRILRSETDAKRPYRGPSVACTQPRVLTAVKLARDVGGGWFPDLAQGVTVGYQTGPLTEKPPAGLLYLTIGVLSAQLKAMPDAEFMGRYRFIVLDEVHERSAESDLTLLRLKNFFLRNAGDERLPFLVLTSATFEPAQYLEYFGLPAAGGNLIVVEGRQHPIREHFPSTGTNDYVAEAARVVLDIHRTGHDAAGRGDVIVFMPGEAEKKDLVALLEKRGDRAENSNPLRLLTLDRNAVLRESADYRLVASADAAARAADPRRWVVVATAVAETGLTIPSLRYVVDCGWARTKETYFPARAGGIVTRPAPESRVRQRFGRVGRKFPGDAFPLYTRNVYAALDRSQLPAIVAEGVEGIFLDLVAEQQRGRGKGCGPGRLSACGAGEFRVEALDLLDAPPALALWAALDTAVLCGFVSIDAPLGDTAARDGDAWLSRAVRGYGLTPLGRLAASFNEIPMMEARVLFAGVAADACLGDLVSAVAMFDRPVSSLLADGAPRAGAGLPPDAPALRAALPRFLREALGGRTASGDLTLGGARAATPPSEDELFYFRARFLIADDFVEAMLVLEAFLEHLAADGGREWCAATNLSFEALVAAVGRREEIVGDLLAAGFDPYSGAEKRLADADPETFLPRLTAIKRCLFEGLRPLLLTYDDRDNVYRGRCADTPVLVPPLFLDSAFDRLRTLGAASVQSKPRWVVTDALKLKTVKPPKGGAKPKESGAAPILYRVRAGMVSVLDDFVAFDSTLAGPRVFPSDWSPAPEPI